MTGIGKHLGIFAILLGFVCACGSATVRPNRDDVPETKNSQTSTAPAPSCEAVKCSTGFHCELQEVQCVRAPCNPQPHCVVDRQEVCGGFAGLVCSDPTDECVDDPTDNCDPLQGGADCMGLCVPSTADGVACGRAVCTSGNICCNASCGICAASEDDCNNVFCAPQAR